MIPTFDEIFVFTYWFIKGFDLESPNASTYTLETNNTSVDDVNVGNCLFIGINELKM